MASPKLSLALRITLPMKPSQTCLLQEGIGFLNKLVVSTHIDQHRSAPRIGQRHAYGWSFDFLLRANYELTYCQHSSRIARRNETLSYPVPDKFSGNVEGGVFLSEHAGGGILHAHVVGRMHNFQTGVTELSGLFEDTPYLLPVPHKPLTVSRGANRFKGGKVSSVAVEGKAEVFHQSTSTTSLPL